MSVRSFIRYSPSYVLPNIFSTFKDLFCVYKEKISQIFSKLYVIRSEWVSEHNSSAIIHHTLFSSTYSSTSLYSLCTEKLFSLLRKERKMERRILDSRLLKPYTKQALLTNSLQQAINSLCNSNNTREVNNHCDCLSVNVGRETAWSITRQPCSASELRTNTVTTRHLTSRVNVRLPSNAALYC